MTLTLAQVRAMLLAAQGLLEPPAGPATPADVLQTIRRMGVLQIDTIHVVARSPYFVLWSRLGSYSPQWLDELLAETKLFEYWAHAACLIPIEEYALYRRKMLEAEQHWPHDAAWLREHDQVARRVMARIRQEGALRSADFEADKQAGGWWNWKEEKIALECMLLDGRLMVRARKNFQRVYDLTERVLPTWKDEYLPEAAQARRQLILRSVLCLGAARASWVGDYFRIPKNGIAKELAALAEERQLLVDSIEGWDDPLYIHPNHSGLWAEALAGRLHPAHTTLLTPFDPLVWHRERARELFNFDYTIECYTPAHKRRYGYFSLPLLHHDRIIGRLDAKAVRQKGIFEVRNLVLEANVALSAELAADVRRAIQDCADWHVTPNVQFLHCEPAEFLPLLLAL